MTDEEALVIILLELKDSFDYLNGKVSSYAYRRKPPRLTFAYSKKPPAIDTPFVDFNGYNKHALRHLEEYTYEDIEEYNCSLIHQNQDSRVFYVDLVRLLREHIVWEELSR